MCKASWSERSVNMPLRSRPGTVFNTFTGVRPVEMINLS